MRDEDEELVLKYLTGFNTGSQNGRPSKTYLPSNSSQEFKARQILTRHLLSSKAFSEFDPLSFKIRQALAELFSPDEFFFAGERTIKFKRARRSGRPSQLKLRLEIGEFIWNKTALRGDCICGKNPIKLDSVIKEAEQRFGLKRRAILIAWADYRRLLAAPSD